MKPELETQIVVLEISSFVGISFGAQHVYGKLYGFVDGKFESADVERPYRESDIDKVDPGLADDYREREQWLIRRYIAAGMSTGGFDTREELCLRAIEVYRQHFPDAKMLLVCPYTYGTVAPQIPLDGPADFAKASTDALKMHNALSKMGRSKDAFDLYRVWEKTLIAVLGKMQEQQQQEEA